VSFFPLFVLSWIPIYYVSLWPVFPPSSSYLSYILLLCRLCLYLSLNLFLFSLSMSFSLFLSLFLSFSFLFYRTVKQFWLLSNTIPGFASSCLYTTTSAP
jgi:hypothetical protein